MTLQLHGPVHSHVGIPHNTPFALVSLTRPRVPEMRRRMALVQGRFTPHVAAVHEPTLSQYVGNKPRSARLLCSGLRQGLQCYQINRAKNGLSLILPAWNRLSSRARISRNCLF